MDANKAVFGVGRWLADSFWPWVCWFIGSLFNGVMLILLLGAAFFGGAVYNSNMEERLTLQELCTKVISLNGTLELPMSTVNDPPWTKGKKRKK
jgi:hypothetical protein|tara:strand:+ start:6136 stop:6417 length:282 start_codon:yes stop_codon:yes gene_type:complete